MIINQLTETASLVNKELVSVKNKEIKTVKNDSKSVKLNLQTTTETFKNSKKLSEIAHDLVTELNQEVIQDDKRTIHFSVIDPNKSGAHNVVIEVRDKNNKVVATIPSEEVQKMSTRLSEMGRAAALKGILVNDFE